MKCVRNTKRGIQCCNSATSGEPFCKMHVRIAKLEREKFTEQVNELIQDFYRDQVKIPYDTKDTVFFDNRDAFAIGYNRIIIIKEEHGHRSYLEFKPEHILSGSRTTLLRFIQSNGTDFRANHYYKDACEVSYRVYHHRNQRLLITK